jgi:hypothetical protein
VSRVDRKLVGFYALVATFVLVSAFAVAAVWAKAPPAAPDDDLAADALHGWLGTTEPGLVAQIESRARQELEAGALRAPRERRIANVLLRRGVTGVGVQFLLEPRALVLTGIEAKCPVKPPGSPFTLFTGLRDVAGTPGPVEQKVDRLIGRQHARGVTTRHEFAVYRIEVLGTREALFALSKDPLVRLLVVDERADVDEIDAARREYERLGPAPFVSVPLQTFTASGGE